MNKSLVIKNKFYLFLSFLISFFLLIYLIYFLVNGERGLISYFKLNNQNLLYSNNLNKLNKINDYYLDRIKRLQPNTIDIDYLEEILRKNTGFLKENEILVILE